MKTLVLSSRQPGKNTQALLELAKKLQKIEDFANNQYLEGIESTTSFSGGYAQALKDLKELLK